MMIIGHRGACGYLPEHTLASFQRAVDLDADAIETDVVLTRDHELICRHDCELSITTDVASRREFAARKTVKIIEGVSISGWFVQDFTLEEIRTLRARERFPFRDHSFDDQYPIISLDDLLAWRSTLPRSADREVQLIVEMKHADYFESIGLPMEEAIVLAMRKFSLTHSAAPAHVECFEIDILRRLRKRIDTPLIQLLDAPTFRPADVAAIAGATTYADLCTPRGLAEIATYAGGIGAWKRLIVPAHVVTPANNGRTHLAAPTSLIADAHAAGLTVHAWTFRNEPQFLAADYQDDPYREYEQFAALGLDGFITDFPDIRRQTTRPPR